MAEFTRKQIVEMLERGFGLELEGVILSGINLSYLTLTNYAPLNFRNANLENANLAGIKISHADFSGANLKGIHLDGASLAHVDLIKANLEGSFLVGATFFEVGFEGANLRKSHLDKISSSINPDDGLGGVSFRKADLSNAILIEAVLKEAVFSGAKLCKADLSGAKLEGADFENTHLYNANFSRAFLKDVKFRGANLAKAKLNGADLRNADLYEANLYGANLTIADLYNADLSKANIYRTITQGWKIDGIKCTYYYKCSNKESWIDPEKREKLRSDDFAPGEFESFMETKEELSESFVHSPDYRSVTIRRQKFSLTTTQARIIEFLHQIYKDGTPEVSQDYILENVLNVEGTKRIKDYFNNSSEEKKTYKTLVAKGKTRGSVRLNI